MIDYPEDALGVLDHDLPTRDIPHGPDHVVSLRQIYLIFT